MYHQSKEWAQKNGARLLKKMKGKGWRLRVHENLGWHFQVYRTFPLGYSIKIYQVEGPNRRGVWGLLPEYWCLFGTGGGLGVWSIDNHSSDPNESVRKQLLECRRYAAEISGNVHALQRLVDQMR